MNEKLNIQNLTDELAETHGLSKKNAESFVKDFFSLIEEALEKDKYVKVKGLGTFKLIDVDSRESINVNTGERIEIQGHSKISFTPDTTLKEVINKPFSAFETVVLADGVEIDAPEVVGDVEGDVEEPVTVTEEENVEEIGIEGEQVPVEEPVVDEPIAETPIIEEPVVEEHIVEEPVPEESKPEEQSPKILPIFDEDEIKKRDQPVSHQEEVKALRISEEKRREISKKAEGSSTPYLMFIAVLIIMFCLGAVAYLYYPDLVNQEKTSPVRIDNSLTPQQQTQTVTDETSAVENAPQGEQKTDQAAVNQQETTPPVTTEPTTEQATPTNTSSATSATSDEAVQRLEEGIPYKTDGDLATHTLQKGETLHAIARKYYGAGTLYTYIVSYNKETIKDQDNVPVGTVIKIPKLVKK